VERLMKFKGWGSGLPGLLIKAFLFHCLIEVKYWSRLFICKKTLRLIYSRLCSCNPVSYRYSSF
jgi:hypothetical protein